MGSEVQENAAIRTISPRSGRNRGGHAPHSADSGFRPEGANREESGRTSNLQGCFRFVVRHHHRRGLGRARNSFDWAPVNLPWIQNPIAAAPWRSKPAKKCASTGGSSGGSKTKGKISSLFRSMTTPFAVFGFRQTATLGTHRKNEPDSRKTH